MSILQLKVSKEEVNLEKSAKSSFKSHILEKNIHQKMEDAKQQFQTVANQSKDLDLPEEQVIKLMSPLSAVWFRNRSVKHALKCFEQVLPDIITVCLDQTYHPVLRQQLLFIIAKLKNSQRPQYYDFGVGQEAQQADASLADTKVLIQELKNNANAFSTLLDDTTDHDLVRTVVSLFEHNPFVFTVYFSLLIISFTEAPFLHQTAQN